jgi:hypothetical protein
MPLPEYQSWRGATDDRGAGQVLSLSSSHVAREAEQPDCDEQNMSCILGCPNTSCFF